MPVFCRLAQSCFRFDFPISYYWLSGSKCLDSFVTSWLQSSFAEYVTTAEWEKFYLVAGFGLLRRSVLLLGEVLSKSFRCHTNLLSCIICATSIKRPAEAVSFRPSGIYYGHRTWNSFCALRTGLVKPSCLLADLARWIFTLSLLRLQLFISLVYML